MPRVVLWMVNLFNCLSYYWRIKMIKVYLKWPWTRWVRDGVFNSAFNNISGLLVEETNVPDENHWPNFITIILYRVHIAWAWFELTTVVLIDTDYIDSCKSNYHTITTTTIPLNKMLLDVSVPPKRKMLKKRYNEHLHNTQKITKVSSFFYNSYKFTIICIYKV